MTKYLIMFFISAICLYGVNIDFKEVSKNPKRDKPTNNKIASYHNGIENGIKSVVNISAKKISGNKKQDWRNHPFYNDPFFRQFFDRQSKKHKIPPKLQTSLGSGVVVSEDGYIVTNNHVVDGSSEIVVTLPKSKKEYKAKIIGTDPRGDLAVIKIEAKNLPYIAFADSDSVKVGDLAFAIGNPLGVGETVTKGIVSAKNKSDLGINEYENFIQTDASINPGNSGGALVDSRGALIGISTAIISTKGGSIGIGFAIPSNRVKKTIASLVTKGKILRGYMGVSISNLDNRLFAFYNYNRGALITNVDKDTPANKAGLKRGDLVIEIEGKSVNKASDLKSIVGSYEPNTKIEVKILRKKRKLSKSVTLAKSPKRATRKESLKELEGLSLQELDQNTRIEYRIPNSISGLLVVDVEQNKKAYQNGFLVGDIITHIEDIKTDTIKDLNSAFKKLRKRKIRVWISRDGSYGVLVIDNE
jgi:serine protease Do